MEYIILSVLALVALIASIKIVASRVRARRPPGGTSWWSSFWCGVKQHWKTILKVVGGIILLAGGWIGIVRLDQWFKGVESELETASANSPFRDLFYLGQSELSIGVMIGWLVIIILICLLIWVLRSKLASILSGAIWLAMIVFALFLVSNMFRGCSLPKTERQLRAEREYAQRTGTGGRWEIIDTVEVPIQEGKALPYTLSTWDGVNVEPEPGVVIRYGFPASLEHRSNWVYYDVGLPSPEKEAKSSLEQCRDKTCPCNEGTWYFFARLDKFQESKMADRYLVLNGTLVDAETREPVTGVKVNLRRWVTD